MKSRGVSVTTHTTRRYATRSHGLAALVLTARGEGAVVAIGHGVTHVAALRGEVVDTSGAGDALVRGLAADLGRCRSLLVAVVVATEAGGAPVQVRGAQLANLYGSAVPDAVGAG